MDLKDKKEEDYNSAFKVAQKYKIQLSIQDNDNSTVKDQISQFCVNDSAFLDIKRNQSIDKTLSKYNNKLKEDLLVNERLIKLQKSMKNNKINS